MTVASGAVDIGLLVLRLWLGLPLLVLHGWPKLAGFTGMSSQFADPVGIGPMPTLVVAILCEVVASLLVIAGLFTRIAAGAIAVLMVLAWLVVHQGALSGPQSGELALLYAGAAVTLALAGPGSLSIDGRRRLRPDGRSG